MLAVLRDGCPRDGSGQAFAMVESDRYCTKNVQNIVVKNLVDVCVVALCRYAVGWTLAYGIDDGDAPAVTDDAQYIGHEFFEANANDIFTTSFVMLSWFLQWAFCFVVVTVVSGGVVERVQFFSYLTFTIFMLNVLRYDLVDVCVGALCWYAIGWTLVYCIGNGVNHAFANDEQYFGHEFTEANAEGIFATGVTMLNWFFLWAFCSAAATAVSGGVAVRVQFPGYLTFAVFTASFLYRVVVHWTWGYGWLSGGDDYQINPAGFMDFAGSGIVNVCGGVGTLVGAAAVDPRTGRFDGPESFEPHNLPQTILGAFILWSGWYGVYRDSQTSRCSSPATSLLRSWVASMARASGRRCAVMRQASGRSLPLRLVMAACCRASVVGFAVYTIPALLQHSAAPNLSILMVSHVCCLLPKVAAHRAPESLLWPWGVLFSSAHMHDMTGTAFKAFGPSKKVRSCLSQRASSYLAPPL